MLTSILITYILSVTTFLILPGPVNLFVVNATLKSGMKGTFWAILGTNLASLVLIAIAGILIVSADSMSTMLLDILTLLGGVFLLYYGGVQIREALKPKSISEKNPKDFQDRELSSDITKSYSYERKDQPLSADTDFSVLKLVSQAFAIGISNPKDVIFFMAFFPPFIIQMQMSIPLSLLILTLIWCILDYALLFLYGVLTQKFIKGTFATVFALLCGILFLSIGLYAIYLAVAPLLSL